MTAAATVRHVKRTMARLELLAFLEQEQRRREQDQTVPFSEIASESVMWVFNPWIPAAKISVLFGEPGVGKSNFTLDIAARLSTGRPMPLCSSLPDSLALSPSLCETLPVPPSTPLPILCAEPATVLLLSAEDSAADTIKPRLEAAGADCSRVRILQGDGHRVLADPEWLAKTIERHTAALVVVDPLSAYVGRRDLYRDQHMRQLLTPIAQVAGTTGAAVLIVHHANKSARGGALMRSAGSIGISAAARSVMMIGRDTEDPSRRILAHVKGNLAPPPAPILFHFAQVESGLHSHIEWDGAVENTAADGLLYCRPRVLTAQAFAERFIREALASGPMRSSELEELATAQGIAGRTFDRAKQAVAVSNRVGGMGSAGEWQTRLRTSDPG